jgi:hypothetical protein
MWTKDVPKHSGWFWVQHKAREIPAEIVLIDYETTPGTTFIWRNSDETWANPLDYLFYSEPLLPPMAIA